MNLNTAYYIEALNFAFEQKRTKNQRFSLRAFARDLDINSGTLSRILKGERIPSMALGRQLALSLKLSQRECELFLNSLATAKWNLEPERVSQELKNFGRPEKEGGEARELKAHQIELEKFKFLSDWIHYAVMELTFVSDFKEDPIWMAQKLGRTPEEVTDAIKRLLELELLSRKEGRLVKTNERVTTSDKTETSVYLKMMQKDLLSHAVSGLDQVEIDDRVASSMTMAIDPKNIGKARKLFSNFLSDMCELLEEGEPSEVYHLLVNLTPTNLNISRAGVNEEIKNEKISH